MSEYAVETEKLTKKYRHVTAVDGLDLQVRYGTVFGFLGPNGAGKTSTINMLLGIIHPSAGRAKVLDKPAGDDAVRKRIGFLPEKISFYPFLTGREFLHMMGSLSGVCSADLKTRTEEALEFVGLAARGQDYVGGYSRGMQQRLGLAQALIHQPELIILDEPTSALDPIGRKEIRDVILYLKQKGCTIFLNSHLLSEIERTCDDVAVLKNGSIIQSGKLDELLSFHQTVEIEVDRMNETAISALRAATLKLKMAEMPPRRITAYVRDEESISEIARILVNNGVNLRSLIPHRESLEDFFVRVVEGENTVSGE
jgi:ABC-2 type transport system ATP-binding protein